ncbi:MAG: phosphoadenylyl-sulfate reductase [Flavisolibacter sp.]|jgi:phosphoadenosine phosphosulfate reductase
MEHLQILHKAFEERSIQDALRYTSALLGGELKFSTSFGQEDQVLTDIIVRHSVPVTLFTIDTGRLFNEVYETMEKTVARYKKNIDVFFPQTESVEQMVKDHGINLFYDSVEKRQSCCNIRKVEPLQRALRGATAWITGLRASQTDHRKNIPVVEWLPEKNLYKINPLLHWSFDDVLDYLNQYSVPYNSLHDKGFVSIGCAPCTRAIEPGENPRAGRWWWEVSQKECGLHVVK